MPTFLSREATKLHEAMVRYLESGDDSETKSLDAVDKLRRQIVSTGPEFLIERSTDTKASHLQTALTHPLPEYLGDSYIRDKRATILRLFFSIIHPKTLGTLYSMLNTEGSPAFQQVVLEKNKAAIDAYCMSIIWANQQLTLAEKYRQVKFHSEFNLHFLQGLLVVKDARGTMPLRAFLATADISTLRSYTSLFDLSWNDESSRAMKLMLLQVYNDGYNPLCCAVDSADFSIYGHVVGLISAVLGSDGLTMELQQYTGLGGVKAHKGLTLLHALAHSQSPDFIESVMQHLEQVLSNKALRSLVNRHDSSGKLPAGKVFGDAVDCLFAPYRTEANTRVLSAIAAPSGRVGEAIGAAAGASPSSEKGLVSSSSSPLSGATSPLFPASWSPDDPANYTEADYQTLTSPLTSPVLQARLPGGSMYYARGSAALRFFAARSPVSPVRLVEPDFSEDSLTSLVLG